MAKHNFLKLEYRTEEVQALEIVGVVDGGRRGIACLYDN